MGEVTVDDMYFIADRIAEQNSEGGQRKEYQALLQSIGMCLARSAAGKDASKEAIRKTVFKSFPQITGLCILKNAGRKRKRFEAEALAEFRMVEEDELRWKYSKEEIKNLRAYMCDNLYTRNSPNAKDTLRERDINGKSKFNVAVTFVCVILSYSSFR